MEALLKRFPTQFNEEWNYSVYEHLNNDERSKPLEFVYEFLRRKLPYITRQAEHQENETKTKKVTAMTTEETTMFTRSNTRGSSRRGSMRARGRAMPQKKRRKSVQYPSI